MGETSISWTGTALADGTVLPGYTFNPWIGCTKVSQGCARCYAESQNKHYQWNPAGWGPGAPRKRTSKANWKKPWEWAKQAKADGVTRRVFCASLADVFDHETPREWKIDLFSMIDEINTVHGSLEWLLLTKRPDEMLLDLPVGWMKNAPNCVRIGITAEDQENFDRRYPKLLRAWSGKNFISYEPALGPLEITRVLFTVVKPDWVVCGGESGAGCRPFDLQWARDLRDQCQSDGVKFFMKQLGGYPNKRHDLTEWPEDLRIQEFPDHDYKP
jgi:protein gp37